MGDQRDTFGGSVQVNSQSRPDQALTIRSMTFNVANTNLSGDKVSRLASHVFPHQKPAVAPLFTNWNSYESALHESKPTSTPIEEQAPDLFICSTQEDAATWSRGQVVGERLAERAGYTTIFTERMRVRTKVRASSAYTSLVIAVPNDLVDRFTVVASGVYRDTKQFKTYNKGGVWVKLRDLHTNQTLGVIGCHLDKRESANRLSELQALSNAVGEVDALMVAGDFNDMRREQVKKVNQKNSVAGDYNEILPEESKKALTDNRTQNFPDTYTKKTKKKNSSGPLDAVFHTNSINNIATTVLNVEKVKGLDHCPVVSTLSWPCIPNRLSNTSELAHGAAQHVRGRKPYVPAPAIASSVTATTIGGLTISHVIAIAGVSATATMLSGGVVLGIGLICLIGLGVSAYRSKYKSNTVLADLGDHALFKPAPPLVDSDDSRTSELSEVERRDSGHI